MPTITHEQVHFEVHPGNLPIAAQFALSFFGSGRTTQPVVVAYLTAPDGTEPIAAVRFIMQYSTPLELLQGVDRESGDDAVRELHERMMTLGFTLKDVGPLWFNRTYQRPHVPVTSQLDPDDVECILATVKEYPKDPHALQARALLALFQGRTDEQLAWALKALQVRAQSLQALLHAADALNKLRRYADALPFAEHAVTLEKALDRHQPGHTTRGQAILWSVQGHLGIPVAPQPGGAMRPRVPLGPPVPRPAAVTIATVLLLVLAGLYLATMVMLAYGAANADQFATTPGEDPEATATALYYNIALIFLFVPPMIVLALLNLGGRNGSRICTWVLCGIALPCSGWYGLATLVGSATSDEEPAWLVIGMPSLAGLQLMIIVITIILLALPRSNAFFRNPLRR